MKGADADVKRMADFILKNQEQISYIALTLDSHQPIHIAHQYCGRRARQSNPALFSSITASDVRKGVWIPQFNKKRHFLILSNWRLKEVFAPYGLCIVYWVQRDGQSIRC